MNRLEPPYPLIRDALSRGEVIPFLGSGASLGDRKPNERQWEMGKSSYLPTAGELATYLANKTQFPQGETRDLAKVAQYYGVVGGRVPLNRELHDIFGQDYPFTRLHSFLAEIETPLLAVTTNYDNLLERAFAAKTHDVVVQTTDASLGDQLLWWEHGQSEPTRVSANKLYIDLDEVSVIYKIHGTVDRLEPARDQYVITEDDYIDFLTRMTRKRAIPAIFAEPFQTRAFLFLGYGLGDWNLRVVLNRLEQDSPRRRDIASWAIQRNPSPLEQRFWQERRVEVYDMTLDEFVSKLRSA